MTRFCCFWVAVYADEMMNLLFHHVIPNSKSYLEEFASIPVPGTLTSEYIKPDKSEVKVYGRRVIGNYKQGEGLDAKKL